MKINTRSRLALTTLVVAASLFGSGAAASAAPDPLDSPDATGGTYVTVVNVVKTYNNIGWGKRITYCGVGLAGTTCTLSTTKSVSIDIQVGGTMTRGGVAAAIGFSASASKSVTVSCTSPPMSVGQIFSAFPYQTKASYQVRTVTTGSATYTGTLYAYQPTGGIYCA